MSNLFKTCNKCKTPKDLTQFNKDSRAHDKKCRSCRDCVALRWKAYHSKNKEAIYLKHIKHMYKLPAKEYLQLKEEQKNKCRICRTPDFLAYGKKLHVDHCHTTGIVRGLLCQRCNTLIGMARDSRSILAAALVYLKNRGVTGINN